MIVSINVEGHKYDLGTMLQVIQEYKDYYLCAVGETGEKTKLLKGDCHVI